MASAAAPAIATVCSASSRRPTPLVSNPTIVLISGSTPRFHALGSFAQTSLSSFSSWHGLKHLRISFRRDFRHKGRERRNAEVRVFMLLCLELELQKLWLLELWLCWFLVQKVWQKLSVARNLGKTLRAFQPTIRELQDVSREFKNTLEREIGLDEVASTANNTNRPESSLSSEPQSPTIDPKWCKYPGPG
ncbi:putative sec-independent protein translocase protein TatA/B/E [Dioscorea sansibarensis]